MRTVILLLSFIALLALALTVTAEPETVELHTINGDGYLVTGTIDRTRDILITGSMSDVYISYIEFDTSVIPDNVHIENIEFHWHNIDYKEYTGIYHFMDLLCRHTANYSTLAEDICSGVIYKEGQTDNLFIGDSQWHSLDLNINANEDLETKLPDNYWGFGFSVTRRPYGGWAKVKFSSNESDYAPYLVVDYTYELETPELIYPVDVTVNHSLINFTWSSVPGNNVSYTLKFGADLGYSVEAVNNYYEMELYYPDNTTLLWCVQAKENCDNPKLSEWSDIGTFIYSLDTPDEINPPELYSPSGIINETNPVLSWEDNGIEYEYKWYNDTYSFSALTNQNYTDFITSPFDTNETYFWCVKSQIEYGFWSNWSEPFNFTIVVEDYDPQDPPDPPVDDYTLFDRTISLVPNGFNIGAYKIYLWHNATVETYEVGELWNDTFTEVLLYNFTLFSQAMSTEGVTENCTLVDITFNSTDEDNFICYLFDVEIFANDQQATSLNYTIEDLTIIVENATEPDEPDPPGDDDDDDDDGGSSGGGGGYVPQDPDPEPEEEPIPEDTNETLLQEPANETGQPQNQTSVNTTTNELNETEDVQELPSNDSDISDFTFYASTVDNKEGFLPVGGIGLFLGGVLVLAFIYRKKIWKYLKKEA